MQLSSFARLGAALSGLLTSAACGAYSSQVATSSHAAASSSASVPAAPSTSSAAGSGIELPPGINVFGAGMIAPGQGWAVTSAGLQLTTDAGQSWSRVTPPGLDYRSIAAVEYQDAQRGWVVGSLDGQRADLYRTADGGRTWKTAAMATTSSFVQHLQSAWIDFIGDHGWIVLSRGDTSQTHLPTLFATNDGGKSLVEMGIPVAAPVRFLSTYVGFTVGGSSGGVFVTSDGGATWRLQALERPAGYESDILSGASIDAQTRFSSTLVLQLEEPQYGVLDAIALYRTDPSATQWSLVSSQQVINKGSSVNVSLPSDAEVVISETQSDGGVVVSTSRDAGSHFVSHASRALPAVASTSFVTADSGWIIGSFTGCRNGKTDCFDEHRLFATDDGGSSYRLLAPPASS